MAPLASGEVCPFPFLSSTLLLATFLFCLFSCQVIRINTGAPVPPGADAVVMVEETKLVEATEEGEEVKVEILTKVGSWQLRWCWYLW